MYKCIIMYEDIYVNLGLFFFFYGFYDFFFDFGLFYLFVDFEFVVFGYFESYGF